jgi:hypothetical protein
MGDIPDPFGEARRDRGVLGLPTDKEVIPLILRHEDVRKAAKDWKTFSSDAPFRVPIPSEEKLRTVRQLPIEADPPEQTDYRKLVEPFFLRAKQPAFVARVEAITERLVAIQMQHALMSLTSGDAVKMVIWGDENDNFGSALALSSNALTLAVGAYGESSRIMGLEHQIWSGD